MLRFNPAQWFHHSSCLVPQTTIQRREDLMSTPSATRPPSLNNSASTTTLRSALKQSSRPSTPRINSGNLAEADFPHPPQLDLNVVDPFPRTQTLQSVTSTAGSRRYTPKVGFDTFQNPTSTTLFSYTLQVSGSTRLTLHLLPCS